MCGEEAALREANERVDGLEPAVRQVGEAFVEEHWSDQQRGEPRTISFQRCDLLFQRGDEKRRIRVRIANAVRRGDEAKKLLQAKAQLGNVAAREEPPNRGRNKTIVGWREVP